MVGGGTGEWALGAEERLMQMEAFFRIAGDCL